MSFLDQLNDQQKEAAESLQGPLLIVAGAGSGKTRALTFRIANIIASGLAQPWQILAVTFTNKAAEEMKVRIEALLQSNFAGLGSDEQPTIGTFHSICVRILRRHIDRLGREKSFVIYDADDQRALMKRILKERGIEPDIIKPKAALTNISRAKNRLQTPDFIKGRATRPFDEIVGKLYEEYENRLAKNNALDFDDLLNYTVRLFQEHEDVLEYYQERWRFINVDEYQDTNHVQYMLTKMLASKYRNLCVIGDSDQSIYSFRGADISNILDFEKDYPDAKLIKLEQNYRSTQNILDVADAIIEKNQQRKAKKMWTNADAGDLIDVWHCLNEQNEADKVAREIEEILKKGATFKDIVILYRTNAQSRLIEEMMLRYGLPYKVVGGVKFYARREIKDLLAYLRIVLNERDDDSLLRIINVPSRKIGATTLKKLQEFALGRSLTLAELLTHVEMMEGEVNGPTQKRLSQFWAQVQSWKMASKSLKVSELIKKIVQETGFKEHLLDGTEEGEMRYENVMELISVASKYDHFAPGDGLSFFLEEVALVADTDQIERNADALTLMTLHSVKGLEYPYVFIVGCEESIFPHSRTQFSVEDLEEERRLMYVGVTRAMKKLYLVGAKQRMIFGTTQRNPISRFIEDIPEHLTNASGLEHMPRYDFLSPEAPARETAEDRFADGDRVRHGTFGEGIVVERRGDILTVAFQNPGFGVKKFAANIAPLEKL